MTLMLLTAVGTGDHWHWHARRLTVTPVPVLLAVVVAALFKLQYYSTNLKNEQHPYGRPTLQSMLLYIEYCRVC